VRANIQDVRLRPGKGIQRRDPLRLRWASYSSGVVNTPAPSNVCFRQSNLPTQPLAQGWQHTLTVGSADIAGASLGKSLILRAPEQSLESAHADCEAPHAAASMNPQELKKKTLGCLTEWQVAEAERQPSAMMFEDLHWVDASTLEFLGLLTERVATASLS
jgi:hypothetical protein